MYMYVRLLLTALTQILDYFYYYYHYYYYYKKRISSVRLGVRENTVSIGKPQPLATNPMKNEKKYESYENSRRHKE